MKKAKKVIFTLNTAPDEYKEVTDLTYPFLKYYAHKIGAEFYEIKDRKFPDAKSITYEKCQVFQLAQDMGCEWVYFIDADALIHPDTMDFTVHIPKDTVMHHGNDLATFRWRYDKYFLRDGRHIGSCTWFIVASEWCLDIFRPLDDMKLEEAYKNIFPISGEIKAGIEPWRLIEDYVYSRNIAKYGLKYISVDTLLKSMGLDSGALFYHQYAMDTQEKVVRLKNQMMEWNLL
jgi:hypothetical protein